MSPRETGAVLHVGPVSWLAPADGGKPFVERDPLTLEEVRALSFEAPADVVSRTRERYVFTVDHPVAPGDYLRKLV